MSLDKVLAISGKPGLYQLKNRTRNGFLATSLLDGKTINVGGHHNVSLLSEIAIYTLKEEVPLREVFKLIFEKESGKETISHKASKDELEEFIFTILPEYDEDRVYVSDIKKIVQWYNILVKSGLTDFSKAEEEPTESEKEKAPVKGLKETKKTTPKTTANKTAQSSAKASSAKKGGPSRSASSKKV